MLASIVLRMMTAIWALVLVLLGIVFVTLGLVLGDAQRAFAVVGAAILGVGLVLALVAWLLYSRPRAERRRRREGARAVAEVLDARPHTMTRIGVMLTYTATVAGQRIEICYDADDPANFEPLSAVDAARGTP